VEAMIEPATLNKPRLSIALYFYSPLLLLPRGSHSYFVHFLLILILPPLSSYASYMCFGFSDFAFASFYIVSILVAEVSVYGIKNLLFRASQ
jgi:hypothetical protein